MTANITNIGITIDSLVAYKAVVSLTQHGKELIICEVLLNIRMVCAERLTTLKASHV